LFTSFRATRRIRPCGFLDFTLLHAFQAFTFLLQLGVELEVRQFTNRIGALVGRLDLIGRVRKLCYAEIPGNSRPVFPWLIEFIEDLLAITFLQGGCRCLLLGFEIIHRILVSRGFVEESADGCVFSYCG
jgi:hypothetical protein